MKMKEVWCRKRWASLRDQYVRHKRIHDKPIAGGSGAADSVPKITWELYPVMDDLMQRGDGGDGGEIQDIEKNCLQLSCTPLAGTSDTPSPASSDLEASDSSYTPPSPVTSNQHTPTNTPHLQLHNEHSLQIPTQTRRQHENDNNALLIIASLLLMSDEYERPARPVRERRRRRMLSRQRLQERYVPRKHKVVIEAEKKTDVPGKKVDVPEKKVDVPEKEADVAEKKADVAEKEADVAEKKADVAEKKADVAEKEADVAEKKADVAEKKADVPEKHKYPTSPHLTSPHLGTT
ncbi:hypothetical protein Pmani_024203 [Petrolisthes manimaculis]|uniref:MADF domain-containing protein n=1 Tax=Petrolisthes manimaculis TaxID=1843537 RepID=A0AAE1P989_9EUCA|nr:hypothetical protein Pmani_024203 [Petrolisthes manimaculis]